MHPKGYGEFWVKPNVDVTQRREDAWACGAGITINDADTVSFAPEQLSREKRPDEKDVNPALHRLRERWEACMTSKGYVDERDQTPK
jgi:hypothetical protein